MKMKLLIIILSPLLLQGCVNLYPIGGAILGGAGGAAVGGPAGAAIGGGAGATAGAMIAGDKELAKAKEEIKALSTGDVNKLVQMKLEEAKSGGFFDSMLAGVYSFVKLALIGLILWNVVPIVYTRYVQKKAANGTPPKVEE